MDSPLLMLVNVILWSTGLSAATLAVLLSLDCLESWRTQRSGKHQIEVPRQSGSIQAA